MLRVGLTGGIGAGKSTVAAVLAGRGAMVVDADRLARDVVAVGSPGLAAVVHEFGPQVLAAGGQLDRAALGRLVFTDPDRRRALERITHPLVAERTERLVRAAPADAVVVHDIPLLVEKGMGSAHHLVLVVDAPEQVRVDRLVRHRGMGVDDAWARIRAQAGHRQRRAAADVWVDTDRARDQVRAAVERLWDDRLLPFERNVRTGHLVRGPGRIALVRSDPRWPQQAARLLARLERAAGGRWRGAAHIGSTAVPGLVAEPVLDLQLGVDRLDDVEELCRSLAAAGFVVPAAPRADRVVAAVDPDPTHWVELFGGGADPAVPVRLHVRVHGGPAWRTALLLRDWLLVGAAARGGRGTATPRWRAGGATATGRALDWAGRTGWVPPPA